MAKTNAPKEKEEVAKVTPTTTPETPVLETPETPVVETPVVEKVEEMVTPVVEVVTPKVKEVAVVEAVTTSTKNVKVHAFKDHVCRIAGVRYTFEKNKEATVPEDVAAILAHSNIVMKK